MRRRDVLAELLGVTPAFFLIGGVSSEMVGCSSEPRPAPAKKPAEPVTGLHALYQMYSHARSWAQDIKVLECLSIRSEEHTSELQSLAYLVCRLLLEKKKK